MKILIAGGGTGGHLMPALALARVAADLGHDVVLVGAARGIEAQILPRHLFRFHLLPMEPFYRRAWWRNLRWPMIALRAWRSAGRVLQDERPAIVIGTGGYAAGPVVWRAQRAGTPTAVQEQNAFPGLTTRWLARGARQVHLGFPEANLRLSPGPRTPVFVFGNPITPPGRVDAVAARSEFGLAAERRTVLVVGGSRRARGRDDGGGAVRVGEAECAGAAADGGGGPSDVQCPRPGERRRECVAARERARARVVCEDDHRAGPEPGPARGIGPQCPKTGAPERRPNHHGKGFRAFASCVNFLY